MLKAIATVVLVFTFSSLAAQAQTQSVKEWTFLVYLNGNNNLDSFGTMNVKQMEKIGSTDDINIVTQWASSARGHTDRLYIVQSNDPDKVVSPVVQSVGNVDMGDWHSLVDFIKWGVKNYPAKHYFVDVWDHGSGWHSLYTKSGSQFNRFKPFDISFDDNTGNSITTLQLGKAMAEAASFMGHKVDLYASDACLMGMAEVAHEMMDSVEVFGGSEEVEPGAGWPYDALLTRWAANPKISATEVARILTEEYVSSYNNGSNGQNEATFAAYNLNKVPRLLTAISKLGSELSKLNAKARAKILEVAQNTQNFSYSDYADLSDFVGLLEKEGIADLGKTNLGEVRGALGDLISSHAATPNYTRAVGLSIWLPTSKQAYNSYSKKYEELKFHSVTHWGNALNALLKTSN